MIAGTDYR